MANPTFDTTALTTVAPRVHMGQPAPRVYAERMPSVAGEFVQTHGWGGRNWTVTGVLHATTKTTRALALAEIKLAVQTVHAKADGLTVGTFLDADGTSSYTNCMLRQYEQASPFRVIGSGTAWIGKCHIHAVVWELAPVQ